MEARITCRLHRFCGKSDAGENVLNYSLTSHSTWSWGANKPASGRSSWRRVEWRGEREWAPNEGAVPGGWALKYLSAWEPPISALHVLRYFYTLFLCVSIVCTAAQHAAHCILSLDSLGTCKYRRHIPGFPLVKNNHIPTVTFHSSRGTLSVS